MGICQDYLSALRKEISAIIISCITLYGYEGLPLKKLNSEFETYCGYSVPYEKFGFCNLRSFLLTISEVFLTRNNLNEEVVVAQSSKSNHMKQLISRQKNQNSIPNQRKRSFESYSSHEYNGDYKKPRFVTENCHTYNDINRKNDFLINEHLERFQKLEAMLPLFYRHQALGDDFFLDIADTKMGYYVPKNGPKECGLCAVGQTIAQLRSRVKTADCLAPRVVVMIGLNDLLMGRNVNNMILDMRDLIVELKKRNTMISLVTLIQSPKLPKNYQLNTRMDIFNQALLEYAQDSELHCNVIDLNATLRNEARSFRKDFDRLEKVARTDPYKVFSDYGRKIFLSSLKNSLRDVLEAGN